MMWQNIKASLIRFMQGRYGSDQLGIFTLFSGLILSLLGSFTGLGLLTLLGAALYFCLRYCLLSELSSFLL